MIQADVLIVFRKPPGWKYSPEGLIGGFVTINPVPGRRITGIIHSLEPNPAGHSAPNGIFVYAKVDVLQGTTLTDTIIHGIDTLLTDQQVFFDSVRYTGIGEVVEVDHVYVEEG